GGEGIGTRLLQEAMNTLAGVPSIRLDATPQGRPVYQRLGFEDEYELCRMQLPETMGGGFQGPGGTAPSGQLQPDELSVRPMRHEDLATVAEADRRGFRADRLAVFRWALSESPPDSSIGTGRSGLGGCS